MSTEYSYWHREAPFRETDLRAEGKNHLGGPFPVGTYFNHISIYCAAFTYNI